MPKSLKLMIVDDDPAALEIASSALAKSGYEVVTRGSPIGTSVAIRREGPDVVLLDVNMPGLSGDRLVRLVNPNPNSPWPVVVLYSGMPQDQLRELARSCGASGAIEKTGDSQHLVDELQKIVLGQRVIGASGPN